MNKLETTFQHIMNTYGHDVLLIHNEKNEPCSCYEKLTGSYKRDCPYCFGRGLVPEIRKYRTRYVDANVPESNVFLTTPQEFGQMSLSSKSYFFYKETKITEGDLIVEVDWDGIKPVYNRGGIYEVSHINHLRYLDGKPVYLKAFVRDKPINKSIRGIAVVKKAGEISYQLAEDKPHQMKDQGRKTPETVDLDLEEGRGIY